MASPKPATPRREKTTQSSLNATDYTGQDDERTRRPQPRDTRRSGDASYTTNAPAKQKSSKNSTGERGTTHD